MAVLGGGYESSRLGSQPTFSLCARSCVDSYAIFYSRGRRNPPRRVRRAIGGGGVARARAPHHGPESFGRSWRCREPRKKCGDAPAARANSRSSLVRLRKSSTCVQIGRRPPAPPRPWMYATCGIRWQSHVEASRPYAGSTAARYALKWCAHSSAFSDARRGRRAAKSYGHCANSSAWSDARLPLGDEALVRVAPDAQHGSGAHRRAVLVKRYVVPSTFVAVRALVAAPDVVLAKAESVRLRGGLDEAAARFRNVRKQKLR